MPEGGPALHWQDVSVPVRPGMPLYAGDPPVRIERIAAIAEGSFCNMSRAELGLHTGTHVDAPLHFIDGAPDVESIPAEALIGPAFVADARRFERHLDAEAIGALGLPEGTERVLIRTRNSALWAEDGFVFEYIALTEDGAAALVARGVRLVGIDYLSVAPPEDPAPVHVTLLQAGVVILEGLDLRAAEPGPCTLACLPLRIPGADGAPARALIGRARRN